MRVTRGHPQPRVADLARIAPHLLRGDFFLDFTTMLTRQVKSVKITI